MQFRKAGLPLLVLATLAWGQGNTGTILGTVTDPSAAVIPGVQVRVVNENTGVSAVVVTDALGSYRAPFLPPGDYQITAESPGFKRFVRTSVRLEVNRDLRVDFTLETGVVTDQVTVEAQVPLVETETGTLSTTMENQMITSLPMLGRNPTQLKMLVPGITSSGIAAGGLLRKDRYLVDGANVSLHVFGGEAVNPNPDVIQEIKVITNAFAAEYGQVSGFLMQAVTKSGANEIHGSLFEFFRNDKLNAGNYYTHQRSVVRFNQFGGTIGGPVRKNKTFFFGDAQLRRESGLAQGTNLTVPSAAVKDGDFSQFLGAQVGQDALGRPVFRNQIFDPATSRTVTAANGQRVVVRDPFPGNRIPRSQMSPAALNLQALYPAALTPDTLANYSYFASRRSPEEAYNAKIDHHFNDRNKLMGRYSFRETSTLTPQPLPGAAGGGAQGPITEKGQQIVLNHVHTFGPRATNDLHGYWFQRQVKRLPAGYGEVSAESFGIKGLPNGSEKLGTPPITFSGLIRPVPLGSNVGTMIDEPQQSLSLLNVTSMIRNRHTIKFGGEIHKLMINNYQPFPYNASFTFTNSFTDQVGFPTTGIDYASFLLGLPVSFGYTNLPGFVQPRSSVYALFVQDDIRVNRKLTVNLGLRWDAPLYYHEKENRTGIFDLDQGKFIQLGVDGFRRTIYEQDWLNFGPRVGFAWTPFAGGATVVRGAYGLSTVGMQGSGRSGGLELSPFFGDSDVGRYDSTDRITWKTTLDNVPYTPAEKNGGNAAAVTVYPDRNDTTYFQQFNLSVQQQVKSNMVEVAYVGTRGVHLPYGGYNMNAIPARLSSQARGRFVEPFVLDGRYPQGIQVQSWIGSSIYHSLQAKVERRLSGGLSVLGAYTWAKMIATGDIGYRDPIDNRNLDRGVTSDSPPHRLTAAWVYQLPWGPHRAWLNNGFLSQILGGWELSGFAAIESGAPLSAGSTFDSCVCGGRIAPNVTKDPTLPSSERSLDRWFDTTAYAFPQLYTVGNSGRGLFLGPRLFNIDAALMKRFNIPALGDGGNLEFRGEAFGLTNTPRFANPNTTVGAGTFGRITAVAGGARQVQLALKLYW